jgi:hypothetical protein
MRTIRVWHHPLALITGPARGLPFYWELIDMSFRDFGVIPLIIVRRLIKRLPPNGPGVEMPKDANPVALRRESRGRRTPRCQPRRQDRGRQPGAAGPGVRTCRP